MTKEEVLSFMSENPVFSLATADGDRPRVRLMMLYRADEDGVIFTTGRDKDVNKQMQANPAVELCFSNEDKSRQVRIEGTVQKADDLELKKEIVEAFPFLKPWVEAEGYEVLIPYRLEDGKACSWTMETNAEPKQYTKL